MRSTRTARIGESPVSTGISPAFAAGSRDLRIVEPAPVEQVVADVGRASILEIDMHRRICRIEQLLELLPLLLAQVTDPTHLSIEGAARALGVSTKTIRRRISAGSLHLETIPETRRSGIAIDELFTQWVDLRTARRAFERERAMKERG
jgi:hypothetical protein